MAGTSLVAHADALFQGELLQPDDIIESALKTDGQSRFRIEHLGSFNQPSSLVKNASH